jgi:leucyl aminopeptidase
VKISFGTAKGRRPAAQALVVPFCEGKPVGVLVEPLAKMAQPLLKSGDFRGKQSELGVVYTADLPEGRLVCLGLGKDLRAAGAALAGWCRTKKVSRVNLLACEGIDLLIEGFGLANYHDPRQNPSKNEEESCPLVQELHLVGLKTAERPAVEAVHLLLERLNWVRDLVNGNAEEVTPHRLCQEARALARTYGLKSRIFEGQQVEAEGMGLLAAVGRAADNPPALIQLSYRGDPRSKQETVLLGKGITYDTGGLSIKTADGMETMRMDMAGAAAVLGAIALAAEMKLPVNVTAVVATAENAVGSRAYRPGDVFTSYSGKRVEVNNTDAEGRLVLADALSYVEKHIKAARIIDLATLTGAIVIALGDQVAGLWSTSDDLAGELSAAGERSGDQVWRMPLVEEYRKKLKSHAADIKNTGGGRAGGSIKAALFLKDFVPKNVPWAHLDIAGTAYLDDKGRYGMVGATGFGLRLLVQFLKDGASGKSTSDQ